MRESGDRLDRAKGVTGVTERDGKVLVEVGSGRYSFTADERMGLSGRAVELIDELSASVRAAELAHWDERRLLQPLADARASALQAIEALHRGRPVDAAERLAQSTRGLDAFAERLRRAPLDAADRARLGEQAEAVRAALGRAAADHLGLAVDARADGGPARPGDAVAVTVAAANGGPATVEDVRAAVTGPGPDWSVDPPAATLAARLRPGENAERAFSLTVPAAQAPATVTGSAQVRFAFAGADFTLARPFSVEVVSPIAVESVAATPPTVRPGGTAAITVTLRNDGGAAVAGEVELAVPDGWDRPAPVPLTVPANGRQTATVTVATPRDAPQAVVDAQLHARFLRDGAPLATGATTLRVQIDPDPGAAPGYDHVDLGNAASEQAHGLTASPSSGTSTEAGLTRRYAGHLTPFSHFEFDMAVVRGEAFVIRAVETYDRAQTKRYKVYVDGQEVHLRTFAQGSAGTVTYEFGVPAARAAGDRVRVRFENQDDPAYFDPSIADVWTRPLTDERG